MKNFIGLLLNGYQGIGNSAKQFAGLVNEYCEEVEQERRNREKYVAEIYQHLSEKRNVKPGDRSPVKMRIDNLTQRLRLDLVSDPNENKKLLDKIIENLIRGLPNVNNYDLTDINVQQVIIKALKAFKPKTDLQKDFRNGLLARLPEAMKKHALNVICQEYKDRLETDIASLMPNNYPQKPAKINPLNKVQQFIAENFAGVENGSEKLNTSIQKYRAIVDMQKTLMTPEPVPVQIDTFNKVYHEKQGVLNTSRDGATKKFCKKVLDFFSGYRFSNWIWSTQGKETGQKMQNVCNLPSISSRISTFS